jgi:radical SAM superfamily enzyme
MEPERAAEVVCRQLAVLPAQTVIGRIGADAEKERLIAPVWVRRKREFANTVDRMLFEKDLWQGKLAAQTP